MGCCCSKEKDSKKKSALDRLEAWESSLVPQGRDHNGGRDPDNHGGSYKHPVLPVAHAAPQDNDIASDTNSSDSEEEQHREDHLRTLKAMQSHSVQPTHSDTVVTPPMPWAVVPKPAIRPVVTLRNAVLGQGRARPVIVHTPALPPPPPLRPIVPYVNRYSLDSDLDLLSKNDSDTVVTPPMPKPPIRPVVTLRNAVLGQGHPYLAYGKAALPPPPPPRPNAASVKSTPAGFPPKPNQPQNPTQSFDYDYL